jgi:hypothetical protein
MYQYLLKPEFSFIFLARLAGGKIVEQVWQENPIS